MRKVQKTMKHNAELSFEIRQRVDVLLEKLERQFPEEYISSLAKYIEDGTRAVAFQHVNEIYLKYNEDISKLMDEVRSELHEISLEDLSRILNIITTCEENNLFLLPAGPLHLARLFLEFFFFTKYNDYDSLMFNEKQVQNYLTCQEFVKQNPDLRAEIAAWKKHKNPFDCVDAINFTSLESHPISPGDLLTAKNTVCRLLFLIRKFVFQHEDIEGA